MKCLFGKLRTDHVGSHCTKPPLFSERPRDLAAVVLCICLMGIAACKSTGGSAAADQQSHQSSPAQTVEVGNDSKVAENETKSPPVGGVTQAEDAASPVPVQQDQTSRWLVVVRATNPGTGCWAKGDFDEGRNKIAVVTENVAEFTIDTDRMPIDWDRLVIISIDGTNAELRRRDYSPLLFRREGHSSWSVIERK